MSTTFTHAHLLKLNRYKPSSSSNILNLILFGFVPPGEAESIMESEHDRLDLPLGTPTFESIEKARRAKSSLSSFLEK